MRNIVIYACTSVLILAALSAFGFAATIYVKPDGTGDYPTIQAGIIAAGTGDIVLLAAGVYAGAGNRDIDFLGKAITVTSESGRDVTIIDCQGLGRGFLFNSGEGSSSVLSGVTIQNGDAMPPHGGGYGAGIGCGQSSPTISNNTIRANSAVSGAGILCWSSSPTISNNIISDNLASSFGGGIYCGAGSSPAISNNTISGNSGDGAVFCYDYSSPSIRNTIISFTGAGRGIYCIEPGYPTLTNCDIYGNVGGDALCGADGGGNISADPLFCDPGAGNFSLNCTSPCVNNPGYGQIGAFGVGCGPTSVQNTTWGRVKAMFR
jgi:parallel beta-helix repeat protein